MLRKLKDFFRERQNAFYIGVAGVVTLSGLAYLAYRNIKSSPIKSHISASSSELDAQTEVYAQKKSPLFNQIISHIQNTILRNKDFQLAGVKAIYEGYYELAGDEYRRLTLQSRTKRRKNLENVTKYWQIQKKYEKEIASARTRSLISLLTFLKIDMMYWLALTTKYSEQFTQEWTEMVVFVDAVQLTSLQVIPKKSIQPQLIHSIYLYKESVLEDALKLAGSIDLETSDDLVIFTDRRLADQVFLKFNVEAEDVFLSMIPLAGKIKEEVQASQRRLTVNVEDFIAAQLKERRNNDKGK